MHVLTCAEGYTVGNHTYHHPDMSSISDKEGFAKEMDDVAALYQEIMEELLTKWEEMGYTFKPLSDPVQQ